MALITSNGTGGGLWSVAGTWTSGIPCHPYAVSGCFAGAGNLIELVLSSGTDWVTNDPINVYGVSGIPALNPVPPTGVTPIIVTSAAIAFVGSWTSFGGGGTYAGETYNDETFYYHAIGTGSNTASWTIWGLTSGSNYQVGLSYASDTTSATSMPWTVYDYDGTTALGSGTINETIKASGPVAGGCPFSVLGTFFTPHGSGLKVMVTDGGGGSFTIVDAAYCAPLFSTPEWFINKIDSTHFTLQNSSFAGTYAGGGYAYRGDNVFITGNDNVTLGAASCDGNGQIIVGSDPGTDGTSAILIGKSNQTSGTSLTVNPYLTLRLRGDLNLTGSNNGSETFASLTLASGSSLIMDAPYLGTYKFKFGNLAQINSSGTTNRGAWPDSYGGNHCVITTDLTRGGSNTIPVFSGGLPNSETAYGGFTNHTFTDFSNIGNSTTFGILQLPAVAWAGTSGINIQFSMTNCTLNKCNYEILDDTDEGWAGPFYFNDNICTSGITCSQFSFNAAYGFTLQSHVASTKQIFRNSFDSVVYMDGVYTTVLFQNNYFGGSITSVNWNNGFPSGLAGNFIKLSSRLSSVTLNGFTGNYFYFVGGSSQILAGVASGSVIANNIYDSASSPIYAAYFAPNAGSTITFTNNILLQIPSTTTCAGSLFANKGFRATVEHNLQVGSCIAGGLANLGNGDVAESGMITSCRSNIIYSAAQTSYVAAATELGSSTFTLNAVNVAGYNRFWNATSGYVQYNGGTSSGLIAGYNTLKVSSPGALPNNQIGTGDATADPKFTDSTLRNFISYCHTVQGTTNTASGALSLLSSNPSLIDPMIKWVRSGYVPTNPTFYQATYPGDTAIVGADGNLLNGTIGPLGIQVNVGYHQLLGIKQGLLVSPIYVY